MELTSERLALRPADRHDLDFFIDLRNHPEILALPGRQPSPRSDVERQLQRWVERWQKLGFGTWTVFDRKTGDRLGRVEFDPIGKGWPGIAPDEVELGCIVHPMCWSRGIATEASELAIADFFGRTDRDRLVALTTSDNQPSLRALAKLGLRHCGQIRHEHDETTFELFELVKNRSGGASPTALSGVVSEHWARSLSCRSRGSCRLFASEPDPVTDPPRDRLGHRAGGGA